MKHLEKLKTFSCSTPKRERYLETLVIPLFSITDYVLAILIFFRTQSID